MMMSFNDLMDNLKLPRIFCKVVPPPSNILGSWISALSNSSGGHIIMGIDRVGSEFQLVGLSKDFDVRKVLKKVESRIEPQISLDIELITFDFKQILLINIQPQIEMLSYNGWEYNFINDKINKVEVGIEQYGEIVISIIESCISLQGNKRVYEGTEDDMTMYIRDLLTHRKYRVMDQTKRGVSSTGKQSGELDLLIQDKDLTPLMIVEALKLNSISKTSIDLHINKIFGYDANGLKNNMMLLYISSSDFDKFCNRYYLYLKSGLFDYELDNIREVKLNKYSDLKIYESSYYRHGKRRILIHLMVSINN